MARDSVNPVGVERVIELLWRAAERANDPDCQLLFAAKARQVGRLHGRIEWRRDDQAIHLPE